MPKVRDKERILKATREKQLFTYKGVPVTLFADFSKETLQTRKNWQEVFKVMKSRDLYPILVYPSKGINQNGRVGKGLPGQEKKLK